MPFFYLINLIIILTNLFASNRFTMTYFKSLNPTITTFNPTFTNANPIVSWNNENPSFFTLFIKTSYMYVVIEEQKDAANLNLHLESYNKQKTSP